MYVFYVDESGKKADKNISHIVYGGLCLHDKSYNYLIATVNKIIKEVLNDDNFNLELHANLIYAGTKGWEKYSKDKRVELLKKICSFIPSLYNSDIIVVSAHKESEFFKQNDISGIFEDLISRFARHLNEGSKKHKQKYNSNGLIVMDRNSPKEDLLLKNVSNKIRIGKSDWKVRGNLIQEDSLFVDSAKSFCMQIADIIVWSVGRYYNSNDDRFLRCLDGAFLTNASDGIVHGITHKRDTNYHCECIACHRKNKND